MIEVIIILAFVVVKAIFSAADTAFTYLNKAEINQLSKKDKKAKRIKELMENSNRFFGVIEMGINLSELFASAYVSVTILESLADKFETLPINRELAMIVSSIILTIILAYIMLVFGGVLPKKIARNNPKKTAFILVNLVWFITKINYPFEKVINASIKALSKIFKLPNDPQERLTEKQIKMIITEGREEGVIAGVEKRILFNALKINDIRVKDIMIPNERVAYIDKKATFQDVLDNISKYMYTRMPVYDGNINNIVGVLNVKDIVIEYAQKRKVSADIGHLLRKPLFLNPEKKIFNAFTKLQQERQMIAIVKDRKGYVQGIVTLEDIIEKVVGNITDEYDKK